MTDEQQQQQPKVVSFLSEKEERKISEGKFYADKARAKKRERKERYKARKAEERQEQMSNEEAATQMLRELGSEHGTGTIDSIVGNTYLENSIPEEFRAEFDAIVDAYAPEVDVPDFSAPSKTRSSSGSSSTSSSRHARPGPGSSAARRRLAEAAAAAADSDGDSDGDAADNEDEFESAGDKMCQNNGFEYALKSILKPAKNAAVDDVTGITKLAGEEAATKRIRSERAARREAAEKAKLKKMIYNKAHALPDIAKQDGERRLRLLATRGVVRLFNAISQHQAKNSDSNFEQNNNNSKINKNIQQKNNVDENVDFENTDEPPTKRGKGMTPLTNEDFLSLLRKNSSSGSVTAGFMLPKALTDTKVDLGEIERKVKEEKDRMNEEDDEYDIKKKKSSGGNNVKKGVKWGALKDDFMLGAKLKDWKKDVDGDDDGDDSDN